MPISNAFQLRQFILDLPDDVRAAFMDHIGGISPELEQITVQNIVANPEGYKQGLIRNFQNRTGIFSPAGFAGDRSTIVTDPIITDPDALSNEPIVSSGGGAPRLSLEDQQRQQILSGLGARFGSDPLLQQFLKTQAATDLFSQRLGRGKNLQTSLERFGGGFEAFRKRQVPTGAIETSPIVGPVKAPLEALTPTVSPGPTTLSPTVSSPPTPVVTAPTVPTAPQTLTPEVTGTPVPTVEPTTGPDLQFEVAPQEVVTEPLQPPDVVGGRPQGFTLQELIGQREQALTDVGIQNLVGQIGQGFNVDAERAARTQQIEDEAQRSREFLGRAFALDPSGLQQGRAIRIGGTLEAERLGQLAGLESELSQRASQEARANLAALQNLRQQNISKSLAGEQIGLEERRVNDTEARTQLNETVTRAGLTGSFEGQQTVQELQRTFDNKLRETEIFGGAPPQTFLADDFLSAFSSIRQQGEPGYRAEWDLDQNGVMDLSDRVAMMSRIEDQGNGVFMYTPPGPQTLAARQLGVEERRVVEALGLQRDALAFDMQEFTETFGRGIFESDRAFDEAARQFNEKMQQRMDEFDAQLGLDKDSLTARQRAARDNLWVSIGTELGKQFLVDSKTGKFRLPFSSGGGTPGIGGGVSGGGSRIDGVVTDNQAFNINNALRNAGIALTADQLLGDRAGSFGSYAARGAALGSMVPGLGTAAGALIGGAIGAVKNFFGGGGPQEGTRENIPNQLAVTMFDRLNDMTKTNRATREKVDNFVHSMTNQQFGNVLSLLWRGGMSPEQIAKHFFQTAMAAPPGIHAPLTGAGRRLPVEGGDNLKKFEVG